MSVVPASSRPAAFESTAGERTRACSLGIEVGHAAAYVFDIADGTVVAGLVVGMVAEQPLMVPEKGREEKLRSWVRIVADTAADSIEATEQEGFDGRQVVALGKPDSYMELKEEVGIEHVGADIDCETSSCTPAG